MHTGASRHRLSQRILTLLIAVNLAACYTWEPATAPLPQLVGEDAPSRIRVTLADGSQVGVVDPLISDDTLYTRPPNRPATAIAAVEDVHSLEVGRTDAVATGLAVIGIPTLVLFAVVAISCCDFSGN